MINETNTRVTDDFTKTRTKWILMFVLAAMFVAFAPFLFWFPIAISVYCLILVLFIKHKTLIVEKDRLVIEYKGIVSKLDEREEFQYSNIKKFDYDKEFLNVKGELLSYDTFIPSQTAKKNTIELKFKDGSWRVINQIGSYLEFIISARIMNNHLYDLGIVDKIDEDLSDVKLLNVPTIRLYPPGFISFYGSFFSPIASAFLIMINQITLKQPKNGLITLLLTFTYCLVCVGFVSLLLSNISLNVLLGICVILWFGGVILQRRIFLKDKIYQNKAYIIKSILPPWISIIAIFMGCAIYYSINNF